MGYAIGSLASLALIAFISIVLLMHGEDSIAALNALPAEESTWVIFTGMVGGGVVGILLFFVAFFVWEKGSDLVSYLRYGKTPPVGDLVEKAMELFHTDQDAALTASRELTAAMEEINITRQMLLALPSNKH